MEGQSAQDINSHLEQANQLRNDTWRLWRYSEESRIVVLCGYKDPFRVTGFLVFRETIFVDLYQWLIASSFKLGDPSSIPAGILQEENPSEQYRVVTINTEGGGYCIVCKAVSFIAIPEGVTI